MDLSANLTVPRQMDLELRVVAISPCESFGLRSANLLLVLLQVLAGLVVVGRMSLPALLPSSIPSRPPTSRTFLGRRPRRMRPRTRQREGLGVFSFPATGGLPPGQSPPSLARLESSSPHRRVLPRSFRSHDSQVSLL